MQRTTVQVVRYKINQNNHCQFCSLYQQKLEQSRQEINELHRLLYHQTNYYHLELEDGFGKPQPYEQLITVLAEKYDNLLSKVGSLAEENKTILKENERITEENGQLQKLLTNKSIRLQNLIKSLQKGEKEKRQIRFQTESTMQQKNSSQHLKWQNSTTVQSERKNSSTSRTQDEPKFRNLEAQRRKIQKQRHEKIEKLTKILSVL